ncbi:MAG: helix-turn-helix domain-containing protein [Terriglobia bacterium]
MIFPQLFHRSTGFAPHQYVLKRRVERAKELLAVQQASLAEVAYRLGFSSQAQFTTTFHHYTGETPSCYRKRF